MSNSAEKLAAQVADSLHAVAAANTLFRGYDVGGLNGDAASGYSFTLTSDDGTVAAVTVYATHPGEPSEDFAADAPAPVSTACPHCGQEPPAHTLNCPEQRAFG